MRRERDNQVALVVYSQQLEYKSLDIDGITINVC